MAVGIKDVFRLVEHAPSPENCYFLHLSLRSPFIKNFGKTAYITSLHGPMTCSNLMDIGTKDVSHLVEYAPSTGNCYFFHF